MSEVFDFDAVVAETRGEVFRFPAYGREWELPHPSGIDWRAAAAAEMGNYEAMREMFRLGFADQWEDWEQHPQPTAAMTALFKAWMKHAGVAPGESQGSSDSSTSTGEPSKRRSAATTASRSGRRSAAK